MAITGGRGVGFGEGSGDDVFGGRIGPSMDLGQAASSILREIARSTKIISGPKRAIC